MDFHRANADCRRAGRSERHISHSHEGIIRGKDLNRFTVRETRALLEDSLGRELESSDDLKMMIVEVIDQLRVFSRLLLPDRTGQRL